ncbi:MAG: hypothetical protein EXR52_01225 [Dehalococcoidia bacterium]|nr:hypothetical protein [Dehalococcoidia bacterium]
METVKISIDGQEYEVEKGIPLVLAAERAGVRIPHLCFNEGLSVFAGCRVCVVNIEGARGLPTSCTTPTADGQIIWTKTPEVLDMQRGVMSLILADHPDRCLSCHRQEHCGIQGVCLRDAVVTYRCLTCAKNGRCEFQSTSEEMEMHRYPMRYYQERHSWYGPEHKELPIRRENPFVELDFNECILCTRCVRACDEVRGLSCYEMTYKGPEAKIGTSFGLPLQGVGCDGCGACVDVCPVASILDKPSKWKGVADQAVSTTCTLCSAGCTLDVEVKDNAFLRAAANRSDGANHGVSCARGRQALGAQSSATGRVGRPLIRRDGKLVESTWDEALAFLAQQLPAYKGAFASIISSRLTNEDGYLLSRFAREVMGGDAPAIHTPVDDSALVEPLAGMLGVAASTNPLDDIGDAKCVLVFGSDPQVSQPVAAWQARRTARFTGGTLMVASPRQIELNQQAQQWLQYRPGTESALIAGLLSTILEENLTATEFVAANTQGLEALQASLAALTPARCAELTGVPEADIRSAARAFATAPGSAIVYDAGITQFTNDTGAVSALVDLALLTGQVGKPGSGIHVLRSGGNTQGLSDLGLATGAVLTTLDAARSGQVQALFIAGADLAGLDATRNAATAIDRAAFVVVAGTMLDATAQLADVVLPLTAPLEQAGTVTNSERRVQRTEAVLPAPDRTEPLWGVLQALATAMGAAGFQAADANAVFEQAVQATPAYAGLSYGALAEGGKQWGAPVLYGDGFPGGKALFRPVTLPQSPVVPDASFPLLVAIGYEPLAYHLEVQTAREDPHSRPWDDDVLQVHADDAARQGVADGDRVRVVTQHGEFAGVAAVTTNGLPGVVTLRLPALEDASVITGAVAAMAAQANGARLTAGRLEK